MPRKTRDYDKEYREYHGTPEQLRNRSERNKARRKMINAGKCKPGDGKEVDHIDGNPRNNAASNLRVVPRTTNRRKGG